jgi:tetratricopeptide (TPR) repeat protein
MIRTVWIIGALMLCAGACQKTKSDTDYANGTNCLQKEEYTNAVAYLERAVSFEPLVSRNHNNLAYAYMQLGNLPNAWHHSRQAVILDPKNQYALELYKHLFDKITNQGALLHSNLSEENLIALMGTPDVRIEGENNQESVWIYGITAVRLQNHAVRDVLLDKALLK